MCCGHEVSENFGIGPRLLDLWFGPRGIRVGDFIPATFSGLKPAPEEEENADNQGRGSYTDISKVSNKTSNPNPPIDPTAIPALAPGCGPPDPTPATSCPPSEFEGTPSTEPSVGRTVSLVVLRVIVENVDVKRKGKPCPGLKEVVCVADAELVVDDSLLTEDSACVPVAWELCGSPDDAVTGGWTAIVVEIASDVGPKGRPKDVDTGVGKNGGRPRRPLAVNLAGSGTVLGMAGVIGVSGDGGSSPSLLFCRR